LALAIGLLASFASSAPSFPDRKNYPTGRDPRSLVIADLNGDGKPELATANIHYGTNTVSVLANRGDGRFKARRDYPTGSGPLSVAVGDLNGDGRPELMTANIESSISVLRNRGDGSFRAHVEYATGSFPFSVASGDLDSDGKADLLTANTNYGGAGSVSILPNRGDGTFGGKVDYPSGPHPVSLGVGDLNADGKLDVVTANDAADDVSVLLNRGDGRLRAKLDYATGIRPNSVAIGDLNGDGNPDLATANSTTSSVSVLFNRGDGSFQPHVDYTTGIAPPRSVAIGDLDGDGKLDLATANTGANSVSLLLNRGDGSFQAQGEWATARFPTWVEIGDLNGDGKPEVVTANQFANNVSVFTNGTGLCVVSNVVGKRLPAARRALARAKCSVGKVRRVYSKAVSRNRVLAQSPEPRNVLPVGGKVNLVVSRGRKR
jgi:hypothetical protein